MVEIISAHPILVHNCWNSIFFCSNRGKRQTNFTIVVHNGINFYFDLLKISSPLKSCVYSRFIDKTDLDAVKTTQWAY